MLISRREFSYLFQGFQGAMAGAFELAQKTLVFLVNRRTGEGR